MTIYIYSERPALLAELATTGRTLAEQASTTCVAITTCEKAAEQASKLGVEKVLSINVPDGRIVDDAANTIADIVKADSPSVLIVGGTVRGKAIAARVAAIADTTALADAKDIAVSGSALSATHSLYGGAAIFTETATTDIAVAVVAPGSNEPAQPQGEAPIENVEFVEVSTPITLVETREKDGSSVDLSNQTAIVCVGKGCGDQAGVDQAAALAHTLGGEVAYSRPVVEASDSPVLGEPYIGVSGVNVKPELYVAVGVSGQTQHMMGAIDSRVVVGINKDANAPIFRQCDYGIVGDAYEVVPALTAAIQNA